MTRTAPAPLARALARALAPDGPLLLVLAGSNGAGKTKFYEQWLAGLRLPFVDADVIGRRFGLTAASQVYEAARLAEQQRRELLALGVSFCMETVFSDAANQKLDFLRETQAAGYTIVLIFIGIESAELSSARVAERVAAGGNDVPDDKLKARFARTLRNLKAALKFVDLAIPLDNSSADVPFRHVATWESGRRRFAATPVPAWLKDAMRAGTGRR
jgi:predicted ABC-type ATPase